MSRIRRIRVHPGVLSGRLRVPGDKSISHRCLILAALSGGPTSVHGLAVSEDVHATVLALERLGAVIGRRARSGSDAPVVGVDGSLGEADDVIDCGNSGTTMRLLAGVVAGTDGLAVLTGDVTLRRRPMGRIVRPLREMGAVIDGRAGGRSAPLVVRGGDLRGIAHRSEVASAQVKSAVLLAGLAADGRTSVESPRRSRDHTERLLRHVGVEVTTEHDERGREIVALEGPATFRADALEVPGDPSSAAFWGVAAAIGGSDVRVDGVSVNPTRTGYVEVLASMGSEVDVHERAGPSGEPVGDLEVRGARLDGGGRLRGVATVDALDEVPVLAIAGAVAAGGLEVRDAGELRVKESDRIAAIARMLADLGATCETGPDTIDIPGGQRLRGGAVDARGDHRIAMAAAVGATVADGPVEISGFDAVASSYPSFTEDLRLLGGRVELLDAEVDGP